jgi:hypothetical protein
MRYENPCEYCGMAWDPSREHACIMQGFTLSRAVLSRVLSRLRERGPRHGDPADAAAVDTVSALLSDAEKADRARRPRLSQ